MGTFFFGGGTEIIWESFRLAAAAWGACMYISIHIFYRKSILKLNTWETFLGGIRGMVWRERKVLRRV